MSPPLHVFQFVSLSLYPCLFYGGNLRADHVSQSFSGWQFYNTCTTLMGNITHITRQSERVGKDWTNGSKNNSSRILHKHGERGKSQFYLSFIYETEHFFSWFHKVLNSEVDFPLCAAEMESQWFSLSIGQRGEFVPLCWQIWFLTLHFILDYYYRAQSLTFFSNEPKLSQAFRAVLPMLKITLVSTNFATEDSKNKNVIYAKSMTKHDTIYIYIYKNIWWFMSSSVFIFKGSVFSPEIHNRQDSVSCWSCQSTSLGQQKAISMHIWAWNSTYILLTSNGFRQMWW